MNEEYITLPSSKVVRVKDIYKIDEILRSDIGKVAFAITYIIDGKQSIVLMAYDDYESAACDRLDLAEYLI